MAGEAAAPQPSRATRAATPIPGGGHLVPLHFFFPTQKWSSRPLLPHHQARQGVQPQACPRRLHSTTEQTSGCLIFARTIGRVGKRMWVFCLHQLGDKILINVGINKLIPTAIQAMPTIKLLFLIASEVSGGEIEIPSVIL